MSTSTSIAPTISSSAMLIDLSISVWSGRKLDRKVSEEIDGAKRTKARAGNYHKNLLAGSQHLANIASVAGAARNWHYARTLAWSDSGTRLLPTAGFMDYQKGISDFEREFKRTVDAFISYYPTLISAAAFTMGDLFDRNEYPDVSSIENRFRFAYTISPVPEAGDFRVDIGNEALRGLASSYESAYQQRINEAMQSVWERVYESLQHIADRLGYEEDGKKRIFKSSTVDGVHELLGLLSSLNVTKDSKLDALRQSMEKTFYAVEADDLRNDDYLRDKVRSEVADMLEKFQL